MNRHYAAVAERAGHRCEYRHAPEAIFNLPFEVEHIVPLSRQGDDEPTNLALSCRACNLFKSDQETFVDEQSEAVVPLYHPRANRWNEHFAIEPGTALVHGLTPTGRATVACLRMNRPVQITARLAWMRLGLYP